MIQGCRFTYSCEKLPGSLPSTAKAMSRRCERFVTLTDPSPPPPARSCPASARPWLHANTHLIGSHTQRPDSLLGLRRLPVLVFWQIDCRVYRRSRMDLGDHTGCAGEGGNGQGPGAVNLSLATMRRIVPSTSESLFGKGLSC